MRISTLLVACALVVATVSLAAPSGSATSGPSASGEGRGAIVNVIASTRLPARIAYSYNSSGWSARVVVGAPQDYGVFTDPSGRGVVISCARYGSIAASTLGVEDPDASFAALTQVRLDACVFDHPSWNGIGPAHLRFSLAGWSFDALFLVTNLAPSLGAAPFTLDKHTAEVAWWVGSSSVAGVVQDSSALLSFAALDARTFALDATVYTSAQNPSAPLVAPARFVCVAMDGLSMGEIFLSPVSTLTQPPLRVGGEWSASVPSACVLRALDPSRNAFTADFEVGGLLGAHVSSAERATCAGPVFSSMTPWHSPALNDTCGVDLDAPAPSALHAADQSVRNDILGGGDDPWGAPEGFALRRYAVSPVCGVLAPLLPNVCVALEG